MCIEQTDDFCIMYRALTLRIQIVSIINQNKTKKVRKFKISENDTKEIRCLIYKRYYNVPSKWQCKYFLKNACPYNAR